MMGTQGEAEVEAAQGTVPKTKMTVVQSVSVHKKKKKKKKNPHIVFIFFRKSDTALHCAQTQVYERTMVVIRSLQRNTH